MQCEGNCEKHIGKVKRVYVNWFTIDQIYKNRNLNKFYYCETAIQKDLEDGFKVKPIYRVQGILE